MIFQRHRNIIILLILFLISECFINPIGNFCLNDDWAYAASVKTLLEKGVFEIGSWPAMTLLSHTLWGLLFVKVFGFSFTVLRLSVLTLSFITVCCTEKFLYKITRNSPTSLLFSLLLLFNPLYLSLSNSYMTDISFLCFFLLSIFSFYYFYQSLRLKYILIAFTFAAICIFIRQLGVILPIGFLIIAALKFANDKSCKKAALLSFALTSLILFALFLFENYLSSSLKDGYCFQGLFYSKKPIETSLIRAGEYFYVRLGLMFLYTGLFLFPVLIGNLKTVWIRLKQSNVVSKVIISVLIILSILVFHYFPCGNYLYNCGLGLETTMDLMELKQNLNHSNSDILFIIIKILALSGNGLLICMLFSFKRPISYFKELLNAQPFLLFLLILLFLYQILITYSNAFFDRYSLCFFVLCMLLLILRFCESNFLSPITIIMLCFYACFSIFAVKDYFNYNQVKTKLISGLTTEKNIPAQNINGGFEYTMWNNYSTHQSPQWIDPYKEYLISFSTIKGYNKINQFAYRRYIPFKIDTIFVLQKNAD